MSFVLQSLLRTSQPQEALSGDKASLGRAVLGIFNPGASLRFGAKDPTTLGGTVTVGGAGRCIDYPGNTKTQYPFDANVANAIVTAAGCAVLAVLDVDTLSNYGCIFSSQDTTTQKCALELRIGSAATDSKIWVTRGTSAAPGAGAYRGFDSGANRISAGDRNVRILISFADNDVQTVPILIINGTQYTMSYVFGTATGVVAAPTSNGVSLGGRSADTVTPMDGRIYGAWLIGRSVSSQEGIALTTNPWQALETEDIWVWVPEAVAGITLVGDTSTQAESSSGSAITQAQAIVGASSTQAESSSAPAITQAQTIVVGSSTHGTSSSVPVITQDQPLTVVTSTQEATSSTAEVSLGAVHVLTTQDSSQASTSSVSVVSQVHPITSGGSAQTTVVSEVSITQGQPLAGGPDTQNNAAGSGQISLGAILLTSTNSTQTSASSAPALAQVQVITCAPAAIDSVASSSPIVQTHLIVASGSGQSSTSGTGAWGTTDLHGFTAEQFAYLESQFASVLAAVPSADAIATAVWAKVIESGLTSEEILRVALAALAGKRQGLGTATEQYMAQDGTTPRITLTPDAYGNGTPTLNGH